MKHFVEATTILGVGSLSMVFNHGSFPKLGSVFPGFLEVFQNTPRKWRVLERTPETGKMSDTRARSFPERQQVVLLSLAPFRSVLQRRSKPKPDVATAMKYSWLKQRPIIGSGFAKEARHALSFTADIMHTLKLCIRSTCFKHLVRVRSTSSIFWNLRCTWA